MLEFVVNDETVIWLIYNRDVIEHLKILQHFDELLKMTAAKENCYCSPCRLLRSMTFFSNSATVFSLYLKIDTSPPI